VTAGQTIAQSRTVMKTLQGDSRTDTAQKAGYSTVDTGHAAEQTVECIIVPAEQVRGR
jgi:hypothetical protein